MSTFSMRKQPEESVLGSIFQEKVVYFSENGPFLRTLSYGTYTNVLLEEAEIDPMPPHRGIVV